MTAGAAPGRWDAMLAGLGAGVAARCVSAPFDVVKIRFQVAPSHGGSLVQDWSAVRTGAAIVRRDGLPGLFRGNVAGTALWGAYAACQFALYDAVQQRVPAEHRHRPLATLAAGCLAAVGATTATFPLDLLRTTMAAQGSPPIHAGMAALVRHTWQQAGPRGFYLGLVPSLVQVVPYMGLSFSFYETARGWCAAVAPGADSTVCSAAAGTLAGCAAKLLVYPLDTAKRRIQVFLLARSAPGHFAPLASGPPHRPPSTAAVLSRMLEHEGVAAAYRGAAVAMLRAGVAAGAHFAVYERLRAALQ